MRVKQTFVLNLDLPLSAKLAQVSKYPIASNDYYLGI